MKKYLLLILLSWSLTEIKSQSLMTVGEIYDYNIGDIRITSAGGYYFPPTYAKTIVMNKYFSSLSDTVFYIQDIYSYTPAACSACVAIYDTTFGDTVFYTNLNDTLGADLGVPPHYWAPDCIDTLGYTGIWVDPVYFDAAFCNRHITNIMFLDNGPQLTDSCYSYFEPYYGYNTYGKGIGWKNHYYNTCAGGTFYCQERMDLLFFKKGTDSCGTAPVIPLPTRIDELKIAESFFIFPNPATSSFTLKTNSFNEKKLIQIFNALGEIVSSGHLFGKDEYKIDVKLEKGIYFIQVSDEEKSVVRKLIFE